MQEIQIFCDNTSCLLVNSNLRLDVLYCVNLQGQAVQKDKVTMILRDVDNYSQLDSHDMPENFNRNHHRCQFLKSRILVRVSADR
jgi:hypothetical protein